MCVCRRQKVHACHCTGMEIRGQRVKALSFYRTVPGAMLGLEAWCLLPLGHLTRVYSSSPGAVRKVTPKANTEECICTYSPRGLRVYRGREAWEQAAGTAARAQAESHILSDKHEHREQLKRGEASHSRSLPP